MIITTKKYPERELKYTVDTGTPSMPDDCDKLIKIVEEGDFETIPNGLYPAFKAGHESGQRLHRPGFKFMFWFYDLDSAQRFVTEFTFIGWRTEMLAL